MTRQHFSHILSLTICLFLLCYPTIIQAEKGVKPENTIPEKITDFKTCAFTSLKRTPQLQRSKMEIEIRQLDEDDSRWSYFPDLTLSSNYYFSEEEATVSFHAANYRPWESHYTLQVRKLITRIVMLNHLQAMAQSLHEIADTFLKIIAADQNKIHYEMIVELSQKRLQHAKVRRQSGVTTALELELEKQKHAFASAEYEANIIRRDVLLNSLCIVMNLPDPTIFDLNDSLVLKQILGLSDSSKLQNLSTTEESINLKISKIKENLQKKRITLAYSKFLPDFSLGFRSPDVLNVSVDSDQSYYFYTGISLPLWDGKKRSRDITRQKMLLRQMSFENKEIENNDSLEWLKATQQYSLAHSAYITTQSIEKLNRVKMKKWEFDYANGTIELPELLSHRIELHRGKIRTIQKNVSFNQAGLKLRLLSGQLLKDTFNISLAEIPYE